MTPAQQLTFIEPAPRPHQLSLSTAELAMVVRYHENYGKSLERELPGLMQLHCRDGATKEAITKLAAQQLAAHRERQTEMQAILTAALAAEAELRCEADKPTQQQEQI